MKATIVQIVVLMLLVNVPTWADVTREAAAATAQQVAGGRVLSVDRTQKDGRDVWRVKVVTSHGEVQVIYIDVETGRTV